MRAPVMNISCRPTSRMRSSILQPHSRANGVAQPLLDLHSIGTARDKMRINHRIEHMRMGGNNFSSRGALPRTSANSASIFGLLRRMENSSTAPGIDQVPCRKRKSRRPDRRIFQMIAIAAGPIL